jgi:DNA-binding transcriptional LysR family regulator
VPELRHLRYFIAVAEELNFSRAAKRLRMAQPPLSAAIRQLEAELGAELFKRSTREVTLTDAGRAMLEGARRTLAEADRAVAEAKRAAAGEIGSLRIGFSWSERFETLPALGQAFRALRPDVELLTEEMWNARMIEGLRSGQIDLAVSLCPERSDGIVYSEVRSEPVVALVSDVDPRAHAPAIALSEFAEDDFVLFPRKLAPRLYDQFVSFCRASGFEPKVRNESFHTAWELSLLGDSSAVALAPSSVTTSLPDGLSALTLDDPTLRLETYALFRADNLSRVVADFVELASSLNIGSVSR